LAFSRGTWKVGLHPSKCRITRQSSDH